MEHKHTPNRPGGLFCACGRVIDPAALRGVRFKNFTGPASLSPKVEEFWEMGDPAVFKRP